MGALGGHGAGADRRLRRLPPDAVGLPPPQVLAVVRRRPGLVRTRHRFAPVRPGGGCARAAATAGDRCVESRGRARARRLPRAPRVRTQHALVDVVTRPDHVRAGPLRGCRADSRAAGHTAALAGRYRAVQAGHTREAVRRVAGGRLGRADSARRAALRDPARALVGGLPAA